VVLIKKENPMPWKCYTTPGDYASLQSAVEAVIDRMRGGHLRHEDFQCVSESFPQAWESVARQMGVDATALIGLLEQGTLSREKMLATFAKELRESLGIPEEAITTTKETKAWRT
jgi:tape measure domain-containing protein